MPIYCVMLGPLRVNVLEKYASARGPSHALYLGPF
jgi:hypothetical protein